MSTEKISKGWMTSGNKKLWHWIYLWEANLQGWNQKVVLWVLFPAQSGWRISWT